jgi:hypothetical protein
MGMKANMAREVAELKRMAVKDLLVRYQEVFGERSRSGNKDFLWKRIAWRMQALAEGSLTERARRRAEELANDADLRLRRPSEPPSTPAAVTKTAPVTFRSSKLPMPGTILTREYKGQTINVTVRDNGFDYLGQVYRSLSAIAKLVTGSHWNGLYFFNLTRRGDQ